MSLDTPERVISWTTVRLQVPDHVVHRAFAAETVVLNLETGCYHGLNPTAGLMLEAVERTGNIADAVEELSTGLGAPLSELESDLVVFCASLRDRGLLEVIE